MADLLFNIDGTAITFKGVTHLLANTESGGKAVYTEESDTKTAYVLKDPEGDMPTFDGGMVRYVSADKDWVIAAVNGADTAADGYIILMPLTTYDTFVYATKDMNLTETDLNKVLTGESDDSSSDDTTSYPMVAGWNNFGAPLLSVQTVGEMQAALRSIGGISLTAFDLSAMNAYVKAMFVETEIAEAKYAQANYAQADSTKPDYIKNRPGGFFLPTLPITSIEWNGERNGLPLAYAFASDAVQVFAGEIRKEHFYGARITTTTKSGETEPTTETITLNKEKVDAVFEDAGYMMAIGNAAFLVPSDVHFSGVIIPAGLYLSKYSTGDGATSYFSKIEFVPRYSPVPVPIRSIFLPESQESLVLKSTTTGSTKKYKITVDDTGTLTTTLYSS